MEKNTVKKNNKVITNSIYNTAGTFIYFFLQWVTTIVVVWFAGYTDAGVFSLVVSFTNIFCFISKYGMRNYQISDVDGAYTNAQYLGAKIIASAAAGVGFIIALAVCRFNFYTSICCVLYMLFKFLESFTDYNFAVFQRLDNYKAIAVSYILKGVFSLGGFAVGLYFGNLLIAIIAMAVLYFAVLLFYDILLISKKEKIHCSFKNSKSILLLCTPLMLSTLITPYMTFIVRYFIERLYGEELLGYYSTISMVVVVMTTIAGSVWVVLLPQVSRSYLNGEYKKLGVFLAKVAAAVIVIGILVVFAGMLLGPWAFGLVFGKEILDYMFLLTPVLIASVMLTLTAFLSTILIPLNKRNAMLWCNVIGAAACTAAVYPLTKNYGMIGANNSLIIGLAVQLCLLTIVVTLTLQKKKQNF